MHQYILQPSCTLIADRDRVQRELCAQIVLGKKDPAKMAIAKMDLAERVLGWAPSGHTQITVSMTMAGCVCMHMGRGDQVCVRVQACGAHRTLSRVVEARSS